KIPLLAGREYDSRDGVDGQMVTIVNQAFVNRFLPGGNVIGRRVGFGCQGLCRTMVGIVGNIRQESITGEAIPEIYLPMSQMPMNGMTVMVRTSTEPSRSCHSRSEEHTSELQSHLNL